jgi:hypothetical protein
MPEATTANQTWRDAVRPEFQVAWYALDRAQIVLFREYADTGDEQIRCLKDKFERATDILVDLVIDELFPETDTADYGPDDGEDVASQ